MTTFVNGGGEAHFDLSPPGRVPPADNHRWISLAGDDGDVWMFDVTHLLSRYNCIYGKGCPGIDSEPDPAGALGCCVHGAFFVDDDDLATTFDYMNRLTAEDWQFMAVAEAKSTRKAKKPGEHGAFKKLKTGEWTTKVHKGGCIFSNRSDFEGGAGCALHSAALRHGERPIDWKPDVCWQVPLRMEVHTDDNERDTMFIRAWERHDWGGGGEDFHWWCIEEPEAYTADEPVYRGARDELVGFIGEALYERLVVQLDLIASQTVTSVSLSRKQKEE